VSNPVELIKQIDRDAADLDRLSKAIHHANARLDVAEHNWEVVYDQMAVPAGVAGVPGGEASGGQARAPVEGEDGGAVRSPVGAERPEG
jgi:hypothetical protein